MAISVLDVAKYFLSKGAPNTKQAITHLKLQKLAYYAQGYYSAVYDQPLFDEKIEAWVHGPVCPDLYNVYKSYGYSEIPKALASLAIPNPARDIMDTIWQVYGQYSGPELEKLTHQEDPWINARKGIYPEQNTNKEINLSGIKSFFKRILYGSR